MSWEDTVLKRTEEDSSQWEKRLDQAKVSYKTGQRSVVEAIELILLDSNRSMGHKLMAITDEVAYLKKEGLDKEARDKLMAEGYQEMAEREDR